MVVHAGYGGGDIAKKKYITRVSKINETNDSVYVQLKALKPRSYGVLSNIEVSNGNNFCKVDQKNRIQMQKFVACLHWNFNGKNEYSLIK